MWIYILTKFVSFSSNFRKLHIIYRAQDWQNCIIKSENNLSKKRFTFIETLRKYPPVAMTQRVCDEPYRIPDTDVVIEKGTKVLVPIFAIHHDPRYYENPDIFDPDRFLDENKKLRNNYAFLPFGDGPRICIGNLSDLFLFFLIEKHDFWRKNVIYIFYLLQQFVAFLNFFFYEKYMRCCVSGKE